MTKPVFLTLQRGEHLVCLRLSLPALALGLASVLAASLALWPEAPADPHTLTDAKRRIAALQSALEQANSQQALSVELLNTRLAEATARLAQVEGQSLVLAGLAAGRPAPLRLRLLEEAIEQTGRTQTRTLARLARETREESRLIEGALAVAGVEAPRGEAAGAALGGPFVPLEAALSGPFAKTYEEAQPHFARHRALHAHLPALPLRAPLGGQVEISSRFGARTDPFHGKAAWHTGLDLRNDYGSEVMAAGAGRVVSAGWNGAYGLTVDVDHGHDIVTRYAHLSRLHVREGDMVEAQAVIGRSGASGRTTGAHLHYELRIAGEPRDPTRMMKAGRMLEPLLASSSRKREPAQ